MSTYSDDETPTLPPMTSQNANPVFEHQKTWLNFLCLAPDKSLEHDFGSIFGSI